MDCETEVVEKYLPAVHKTAHQMVREYRLNYELLDDLKQEGKIAVFLAYRNYNPDKGATLATYVFNRMRWAMIDFVRSIQPVSHQLYERGLKISIIPLDYKMESDYQDPLERINIEMILEKIPSDLKKIIILHYFSHYSLVEIGENYKVSPSRIGQKLNKAYQYLYQYLA